jgi:hypothetical protein
MTPHRPDVVDVAAIVAEVRVLADPIVRAGPLPLPAQPCAEAGNHRTPSRSAAMTRQRISMVSNNSGTAPAR